MTSTQKTLVIELNQEPENQRLLAGEPGTCGMRSGRVYLAPGKACGQHSTKDREELLVFLSGNSLDHDFDLKIPVACALNHQ